MLARRLKTTNRKHFSGNSYIWSIIEDPWLGACWEAIIKRLNVPT